MEIHDIDKYIKLALKEDLGGEDITTNALVPVDDYSKAHIVVKENAMLCGLKIAREVFKKLDPKIIFHTLHKDSDHVEKNMIIATIKGQTRAILTGERTALNFLGYLSGIATHTHKFIEAVRPYDVEILDTRKTAPGLRQLKKYAVKCGGGKNHRINLNEMVMIKDNHREACHPHVSITESIHIARRHTRKTVEIEVDTLDQFLEAIKAHPDIILLDNMSFAEMKEAVKLNKKSVFLKKPLLEASGGITLHKVRHVAETGVDRISIGSLTHTTRMIDVSLELLSDDDN
ncbi:MAG: carboxylating nicotinate-nucleotide diphosphorylase [Candidatus Omnitrophica bacterium]|nr:carboxylating nicotinate-nucleotide diphosphorylase [Candidatus Omnitrophota bacterium]